MMNPDGADFVPRSARGLFNQPDARLAFTLSWPQDCHSQANLAAMLWPYKVGAPAESAGAAGPLTPYQKLQEIEARCREVPWLSAPFPPCAAPSKPCAPERPPSRWCRPWERSMTDMCRWFGLTEAGRKKSSDR